MFINRITSFWDKVMESGHAMEVMTLAIGTFTGDFERGFGI